MASASTPTKITISLGSIIGLGILVWLYLYGNVGAEILSNCQVNAYGQGSCNFSNTGWTPGAVCVEVRIVNSSGSAATSGAVCSGSVWPRDSSKREVSVLLPEAHCGAPDGTLGDGACEMSIVELGESKEEAKERSTESADHASAEPEQAPAMAQDQNPIFQSADEAFAFAASQTCGEMIENTTVEADMNDDGIKDLVMLFSTSAQCVADGQIAGNAGAVHVAVFSTMGSGQLKFTALGQLDAAYILMESVTSPSPGVVSLTALQRADGDPNCCPSIHQNALISLRGTSIAQSYRDP